MVVKRSDLARLAQALEGLPILGCMEDSPAARAGVRYGDVLLAVDGHATPTLDSFLEARRLAEAVLEVKIFRDGETLELSIPLERTRTVTAADMLAAGARALGVELPEDSDSDLAD
jgi:S1-C subfamily serine protease